jgi:hypothetical protein
MFIMMKIYVSLFAVLIMGITLQGQTTITEWNFDDETTNPQVGSGSIALIGGVEINSTGFAGGNPSTGKGYNTKTYPAQSTASATAGIEFSVSTVGKSNIGISFDQRGSGTSSRWAQFEYSTDGSNWIIAGNNNGGISPHDVYYSFSVNLTSCTACNNNANFKFRIVSIFSPVAFNTQGSSEVFGANEAYHRSREDGTNTSAYAAGGTWRFDNVKFIGGYVASTDEISLSSFNFYPNPATHVVNFNREINLKIFNTLGQQLKSYENTTQVDVSDLAKGIYILANDKGFTQKLVVE